MALFGMCPYKILLVLLQCVSINVIASVIKCPGACKCDVAEVKCLHQGITVLPKVPNTILSLDLRFNKINEIKPGELAYLTELNNLVLNDNEIKELRKGCFQNLTQLEYLHLYKNHIRFIDSEVFANMPHLKELYLHSNKISQIQPMMFSHMPVLERLYLHKNTIEKIPEGSFAMLPRLQHLRLDSNPLECDCSICWFVQMAKEHPEINITATCYLPLYTRGNDLLNLTGLISCGSPVMSAVPEETVVEVDGNVLMNCDADGFPFPDIKWFRDSVLLPKMEIRRHHITRSGKLMLFLMQLNDSAHFQCVAKNILSEIHSKPVHILVKNTGAPNYFTTFQDEKLGSAQIVPYWDCGANGSLESVTDERISYSLTTLPVTRADIKICQVKYGID